MKTEFSQMNLLQFMQYLQLKKRTKSQVAHRLRFYKKCNYSKRFTQED